MIYLRLRDTTTAEPGRALRLGEVADVLADASLGLNALPVHAPRAPGMWKLDALSLIREIQARHPNESVVLLGSAQGTLICKRQRKSRWSGLRAALAFALLFAGSSAARLFTGDATANPWWIALPYVLGVGSGAAFYYVLTGRKTASPLDIRPGGYRRQAQAK